MGTIEERVLEETKKFHAQLAELQKTLGGQWVVFLNGKVQSSHTTEAQAFDAALKAFGLDAGFVVAQVAPIHATPVTAAVAYGFA